MKRFATMLPWPIVFTTMTASAWIVPQDIDGDGDQDLIGTLSSHADADVCLWANEGSVRQAKFGEAKKLGKNAAFIHPSRDHLTWRLLSPGIEYTDWQKNGLAAKKEFALPQAAHKDSIWALADYNGDGHTDVIVFSQTAADAKARIFYGRADGSHAEPFVLQADGKDLDAAGIRSPHFVNLDEDDDHDLIGVNAEGQLIYYENRNTNSEPLYAAARILGGEGIRSVAPCDWDGDALVDLLIGTKDGKIGWMKHTAAPKDHPPVFSKAHPLTI